MFNIYLEIQYFSKQRRHYPFPREFNISYCHFWRGGDA